MFACLQNANLEFFDSLKCFERSFDLMSIMFLPLSIEVGVNALIEFTILITRN